MTNVDELRGATLAAIRQVCTRIPFLAPAEAAKIVRVEVTLDAVTAIASTANVQAMIAADESPTSLRRAYMRSRGAFEFCGVTHYIVHELEDGAEWRVVNPLA